MLCSTSIPFNEGVCLKPKIRRETCCFLNQHLRISTHMQITCLLGLHILYECNSHCSTNNLGMSHFLFKFVILTGTAVFILGRLYVSFSISSFNKFHHRFIGMKRIGTSDRWESRSSLEEKLLEPGSAKCFDGSCGVRCFLVGMDCSHHRKPRHQKMPEDLGCRWIE